MCKQQGHNSAGGKRQAKSPRKLAQARQIEKLMFRRHGRAEEPYRSLIVGLRAGRFRQMTDVDLGKAISLSVEEREAWRLFTLEPAVPDETPAERAKRKDRDRKRLKRAASKLTPVIARSTMRSRCTALLRQMLSAGPRSVAAIMSQAIRCGLERHGAVKPGKSLQSAKAALGVISRKEGFRGWIWAMPATTAPGEKLKASNPCPVRSEKPRKSLIPPKASALSGSSYTAQLTPASADRLEEAFHVGAREPTARTNKQPSRGGKDNTARVERGADFDDVFREFDDGEDAWLLRVMGTDAPSMATPVAAMGARP